MGIRRVTGGGLSIPGVEGLARWLEFFSPAGWDSPNQGTAWSGRGFNRNAFLMGGSTSSPIIWNIRGNQAPFFRVVNDIKVIDVFAIAGVVGAQESAQRFRPFSTGVGDNGSVDFVNTWSPLLEPTPGVGRPLAMFVEMWVRKQLAGDATSSAQFIGFLNDNGDLNFSRRVARIGIMGDGALGFRFGSLNCPNAPAGGADNAATDIDADSLQPSVLVNPGVNWFHVIVKAVPGIEGQPGRFGCYLSGRLVKTYTDAARFPRTSRSVADSSGAAYTFITPGFCAWGNGGAAPSPGYYVRNIRVGYTEDMTL